jgi:arsenate reductase
MPRQSTWPGPAPSVSGATGHGNDTTGPRAAAARSRDARGGAEAPSARQAARLRLLPGAGEQAQEGLRSLVVFVGVGDDRRSRIAAALLAYRSRGRVQAVSVSPVTLDPDPVVVRALADIGVDLLGCRSSPPSTELLEHAAVVVVMGYLDPAAGGPARCEDWFIDDPSGKDAENVRYLRDAIDRRVQRLLVRLGGAGPSSRPAARRT